MLHAPPLPLTPMRLYSFFFPFHPILLRNLPSPKVPTILNPLKPFFAQNCISLLKNRRRRQFAFQAKILPYISQLHSLLKRLFGDVSLLILPLLRIGTRPEFFIFRVAFLGKLPHLLRGQPSQLQLLCSALYPTE